MQRKQWQSLDAGWQFAINDAEYQPITLPFSPESSLSGVNKILKPGDIGHYLLQFAVNKSNAKKNPEKRLLLHFGAVDQRCKAWLNGHLLTSTEGEQEHCGGYWPFSYDITDYAHTGAKNTNILKLDICDDSNTGIEAHGKQSLKAGGMWYTPQSGIWQTVWLEWVPQNYIESLIINPQYDAGAIEIGLNWAINQENGKKEQKYNTLNRMHLSGTAFTCILLNDKSVCVEILDGKKVILKKTEDINYFRFVLPNFKPWSPDNPFLYTIRITVHTTTDIKEDIITSYFALRKVSLVYDANGLPRFGLNNKPLFLSGLLDQGYWQGGLYTAPNDEAIITELTKIKQMGFNMLRKHIKIEPLKWYTYCDILGIIVWQDFVSHGGQEEPLKTLILPNIGFTNTKDTKKQDTGDSPVGAQLAVPLNEAQVVFERDMHRTINLLRNHPCIAVWVPFNEGWGQFDSLQIADEVKQLDPSRLIDHASGWHDQGGGDFYSIHFYKPWKFNLKHFKGAASVNNLPRIKALTEFGGYSCPVTGHMQAKKVYGYKKFEDLQDLNRAIKKVYLKEIAPAIKQGLSAIIYTQVSDVEDEVNGLWTYDRAVTKVKAEEIREMNDYLI
ncbi:MAG: glycoside hydrolase family 2 [Spirochaetaceae bacterium]|jgi:beta-galactosidase/beta-glucuronidase|nr:glycoside hydrolase family 2 [Spirochaetaceae bacterium]